MPYRSLAPLADIPTGRCLRLELDGTPLLATQLGGEIHVVGGLCSHRSEPLAGGRLTGHVLACPAHGGEFDIRTGAALSFPAMRPIAHYRTREVSGVLEVDWPGSIEAGMDRDLRR